MKKAFFLLIIIFFSIVFNFTMENDTNEKFFSESLVSVCSVIVKNIELNICSGIKFSILKNLFLKSSHLISENLSKLLLNLNILDINSKNLDINISLIHKNGNTLLTTNNEKRNDIRLNTYLKEIEEKEPFNESVYFFNKESEYSVIYKIKNNDFTVDYFICVTVDKNIFTESLSKERHRYAFSCLIIFFLGSILLFILIELFFTDSFAKTNQFSKKFILFVFLFITFCNLLLYYSNINRLINIYSISNNLNISCIYELIEFNKENNDKNNENIKFVKNSKLKNYIRYIFPTIKIIDIEINNYSISPNFYNSNSNLDMLSLFLDYINSEFFKSKLFKDENLSITLLNENYESENIQYQFLPIFYNNSFINILFNSSIKILISILFLIELLYFYKFVFEKSQNPLTFKINNPENHQFKYMRTAAFLFLFGIDLSISFVPIYSKIIYFPIFGFSEKTIIAFPITVEFIFVGISIFCAGVWSDRRGWHEPFLIGSLFASVASILCWAANNFLIFIALRAIVGLGYGLMLLSSQVFIISNSSLKNRTFAIAQFISGIYAGSICGAATGAILSEQLGYKNVFLLGGIIIFSVLPYYYFILSSHDKERKIFNLDFIFKPKNNLKQSTAKNILKNKLIIEYKNKKNNLIGINAFNFLKNKIVLCLILFSSFPAAIGTVGFLNYFTPLYLQEIGASQSVIGSVFIIYGFSLVYIGPVISKFADRSKNKKYFIFIGCSIASLTFMIFYFSSGILITLVASFFLGISTSLVIASQSSYLLSLDITKKFGEGKALGIFRATSRAGQAAGPIIFSCIFLGDNLNTNMAFLGLFFLLSSLIFLIITYRDYLPLKE